MGLAGTLGDVGIARLPFLFGHWTSQSSYFSTDLTSRYFEACTRARLIKAGITHTEHFLHWIKAAKMTKSFPLCYFSLKGWLQEHSTNQKNISLLWAAVWERSGQPYTWEKVSGPVQHLHPVADCGYIREKVLFLNAGITPVFSRQNQASSLKGLS